MKKNYFLLLLLFVTALSYSQQVPRNYVLVEIATGTWCTYCPGAAMGADDLIANGHPAAVIENHNGDSFTTPDSDARNSYYGTTGYPTAQFDGSYSSVGGGSHTQSKYSSYYPIVDSRINEDSDFTLEIFGINDGDDYTISVRLQDVGGYAGENLRLRFALTESEITYSWQDQDILNFVNRLMLPDHNGTDLSSYDLTELTIIELPFTFDNSWNDQHCEIVVFVQDDDNKEVLQSQKVELLNLESMLSANFTASTTITCAGSSIDFTDESDGEGIGSWTWTFEGGTPSISTDQNPTVTYESTGVYDVELTVTDAYGTSTTLQSDYISILETPSQAGIPDGDNQLCTGLDYYYSIPEVEYAQTYEWELIPESAGTLIVSDNMAVLEASNDWTGEFIIHVRATNLCGDGEWSDDLAANMYFSPEEYISQGGGGFCTDSEGVEITLSDSDTGIEYELYLDDVPTGNIVTGTGDALSFGMINEVGFYSITGYTANCATLMMEQLEVYEMFAPDTPGIPAGPDVICNFETAEYTSSGSDNAESYEWVILPEESGTLTASGLTATVEWSNEFSGPASISIYGINACGDGDPSEVLQVAIESFLDPVVTGLDMVCDFEVTEYSTEENDGCSYTWEVTGGTIIEGQGTATVSLEWGNAGTGLISIQEESPNGCIGNSEEFEVFIDECTDIEEGLKDGILSVYPNPASNNININIKLADGSNQTLLIWNQLGQVVKQVMFEESGTNQTAVIDINDLPKGMYFIGFKNSDKLNKHSFIKN